MAKVFISDYDGTITRRDFYSLLAERYVPADAPDFFAQYRRGEISHLEAMASYFAYAPADECALEALLEATQPDPALGESARRLERAGWELIVVSAGSSWYIEKVLARAGVHAAVYSNPGHIASGRGLVLEPHPPSSRFYCPDAGVDKASAVRDALARAEAVAFAGDGPPDIHAALLVRPELRFARGLLAEDLRTKGEAFQPFSCWSEIAHLLALSRDRRY